MLESLAAHEPGSFVDGPFGSELKTSEYVEVGTPLIRIQNVKANRFLTKEIRYITERKAGELARHNYEPGDVVITKLGDPCGVACVVPEEAGRGIIVADIVRFRGDRERIDHKFLSYFINSPIAAAWVQREAKGTTRQRVNLSNFKMLPVPMPPLTEQRRIANILDKADALRAKRRAALVMLERLAQSIFRNTLMQAGSSTATTSIEDGMDAIIDYRGKSPKKTEVGVPLITARVVKNGQLLEPNEFIDPQDFKTWMRRGLPKAGDVLFTTEAPLGEVAQLDGRTVALAQRLLVLRGKPDVLDNTFLRYVLTAPEVRRQIDARSTGSTVRGIRQRELRKVMLPIPPVRLQREFARRIGAVEALRTISRASGASLDSLFKSLEQRAFTGGL